MTEEEKLCFKCERYRPGAIRLGRVTCSKCGGDVGKLRGIDMGLNEQGEHISLSLNPPFICPHCGHQADYWHSPCKGSGEIVIVRVRFPEHSGEI